MATTTTTETTLSAAVQVLVDLEAEEERLSLEAARLSARLSEINNSWVDRLDAIGAAQRDVIAAAKLA